MESRAAHTHPKNTQVPPREGTMINWSTLMKKFMQTRCKRNIVIVCGSILNVSTVYLNTVYWIQSQDSKPSADNNTRYSPSQSITEWIKFSKRVELWTDFWQLDDIFEPPGRSELIVWKTDSRFFFLAPDTPLRACEARVLRAPKTLTSLFAFFFHWFWASNQLFCSLKWS